MQSDSVRRFSNTQIENKEPIRSALGREMAEWLAAGNEIHVLPGPTFVPPRPTSSKPKPKLSPVTQKPIVQIEWSYPLEVELVRKLKTETLLTNDQIATKVNEQFGNGRNGNAVKGICRREGIKREPIKRDLSSVKVLGAAYGPGGWEPREDALLCRLLDDSKTIPEMQAALKAEFGSERSDSGVRGRITRLGLQLKRASKNG